MTPENAYNEWRLLFGFREVSYYKDIDSRSLHDTARVLYDEGYLRYYPETKSAHYKLKQPHEIKGNNDRN